LPAGGLAGFEHDEQALWQADLLRPLEGLGYALTVGSPTGKLP
jgi:hypothetical protein